MTEPTRALFQCDGAPIPAAVTKERWHVRGAINHADGGELTLRVENIAHALLGRIDPRAQDLFRIAAYVYAADQRVRRSPNTDVLGDKWQRDMQLWIPVEEPDFWGSPEVHGALTDALHTVSGDRWTLGFAPAGYPKGQLIWDLDPPLPGDPDSVLLLSGGADSLCALVEATALQGRRPVVVSHGSSTGVVHRQQVLLGALKELYRQWTFPSSRFKVQQPVAHEHERTRRTRAFLFACLGAVVASAYGLRDVILADNGVVSVHLPTNDQLIGTLASRSTHPKFLARTNRALAAVFTTPPVLRNPLGARTRPECLEVLKQAGAAALLYETNSCAASRNLTLEQPFCGVCSQCVDRRFGALAAGIEVHDPIQRYVVDIFQHELDAGDDRTIALSYYRFAQRMDRTSNPDAIMREFAELTDAGLPEVPGFDERLEAFIAMLRRHGSAVVQAMGEQIKQAAAKQARNELPPHCLILLAAAPDAPTPEETREPKPAITLTQTEQRDFRQRGLKSKLPIWLGGTRTRQKSNIVLVGGEEIYLSDTEFVLLLRFVLRLFTAADGFIARAELDLDVTEDGQQVAIKRGVDQRLLRLRTPFRGRLGSLLPNEFIETREGRFRLSTVRKFVSWDETKLAEHTDGRVRFLVGQLMIAAKPMPPVRRASRNPRPAPYSVAST